MPKTVERKPRSTNSLPVGKVFELVATSVKLDTVDAPEVETITVNAKRLVSGVNSPARAQKVVERLVAQFGRATLRTSRNIERYLNRTGSGLTKKEVKAVFESFTNIVEANLPKYGRLRVPGVGVLRVKEIPARPPQPAYKVFDQKTGTPVIDPLTNQQKVVAERPAKPAKRVPKFSVAGNVRKLFV